jgi:ribonucleoside-triphosphate reductase
MDIKSLKLYKPFVTALNRMKEKYGEDFERMNGFHTENLNFTDFIDNFIDADTVADTTIDANANSSTHDIRTLLSDMVKPHTKLLSFNKIFYEISKLYSLKKAEQWLEEEWNGSLYIHDSSNSSMISYCYAYDLDQVVEKGLFFMNNMKTDPPQHLTTFSDHVLEFVSWTANRTAGAVGLPSYLLYSYYFWHKDVSEGFYLKDPEYYRRQCFQKTLYDLNQEYLRVTECAFTNITIMDREYLTELFGGRKFPNGEYVIDHIEGIIEHQKAFMEVVAEVRRKHMFTFPVLTFSLLYQDGKFVDEEFARWCSDHNTLWYDSNFYVGESVTSLSSCCRLTTDLTKLDAFINSIGGTSLSIGSVKVNTINLRRIALESRSEEAFISILKDRLDICITVLDVVRNIIRRNIEKGLLPNYTHGLIELSKQYNTIGITAMFEAVDHFGYIDTDLFGNKSYSEKGLEFASRILDTINQVKDSYTFDYSLNVEAVPAERANVVLCSKDNWLYPQHNQHFIYSNQWIPLMEKCTIAEKIRLGSILDRKCGGGQISHINIDGPFADTDQAWEMLNHVAASGVIYHAYNTRISVCEASHGFFGEICPECGKPKVDTYSRVVGFLVPQSSYSKERKIEFDKRQWYSIKEDFFK